MDNKILTEKSIVKQIDWAITFVPLLGLIVLCGLFIGMPEQSKFMLVMIRDYLCDEFGLYFIFLGLFVIILCLYIAFSKYGAIKHGNVDKPAYGQLTWGIMIYTSTMAADILFYSICEWSMYMSEPYVQNLGEPYVWAPVFPLLHWGPSVWGVYILLAVAFGFMLHVRGRTKQKYSQACRPILGSRVDGPLGRAIDLIGICCMLCAMSTAFSVSAPLMAGTFARTFGISESVGFSIVVLILTCIVWTAAVLMGMKGISKLSNISAVIFLALLAYVLFVGGEARFVLETSWSTLGTYVQNLIGLSTWTDPLRTEMFPQYWTVFYWANWIPWGLATPVFIAAISKGRTIKEMILGAFGYGIAGTYTSFFILGHYGLAQQMKHGIDIAGTIADGIDPAVAIMMILETIPFPTIAIFLLGINMMLFYATTFDAITLVTATYSHYELEVGKEPDKKLRAYWGVLFILLPIALLFSENSIYNLQSVTIIVAFPISLIQIIILVSFFKDAKKHLTERK